MCVYLQRLPPAHQGSAEATGVLQDQRDIYLQIPPAFQGAAFDLYLLLCSFCTR